MCDNKDKEASKQCELHSHSSTSVVIPELDQNADSRIEQMANSMASLKLSIKSSLKESLQDYLQITQTPFYNVVFPSSIIAKIKDEIAAINIPEISEENRRKLLDSHILWGKYGWTLIPVGDDTLFDKAPNSKKEADRTARKACHNIDALFEYIRQQNRLKKEDFEEATADFKEKRYKSCAMILLALIDSHLIRFQRKIAVKTDSRKVGIGAVNKAKNRIHLDSAKDDLFYSLFYVNLFSCLDVVFENTQDFTKKVVVINRNYLDHGMLTRKVTRTDCLQLFLLYYNVLEMLDLTY